MLDASNIIQVAEGGTGATPATTVDVILPNPATAGNALILSWTRDGQANAGHTLDVPTVFAWTNSGIGGGDGGSAYPWVQTCTRGVIDGETTVASIIVTNAESILWSVMEISGICSGTDPEKGEENLAIDWLPSQGWVSAASATLTLAGTGTPSGFGDEIIFAAASTRSTSGAPPTFSSIADITGGIPGTWTRMGTSQATSSGGTNVALDVFYRFAGGEQSLFDATVTYGSAGANNIGVINAYKAFWVNPEQTRGRAATNSMY